MKGRWSSTWNDDLLLGTWNCFSYSNERHEYCKSLGYDVLDLRELHGKQLEVEQSKSWVVSAKVKNQVDPEAGVIFNPLKSRGQKSKY